MKGLKKMLLILWAEENNIPIVYNKEDAIKAIENSTPGSQIVWIDHSRSEKET